MSKETISHFIFLYRIIFAFHFYIYFLVFIDNINEVLNEDINGVNAPFPVCIQLKNNKLLLVNQVGIFLCDEDLNVENSFYHSLSNYSSLIEKVYLIEFENDGYAICLINNIFYFINPDGGIINTFL